MFDRVLFHFRQLCAIPHGSGNTSRIADYCETTADLYNLKKVRDEAGNLVIYVPASSDCTAAPSVILQGHLDMVCAKEDGCEKDMSREGLDLVEDDDLISASGTSLGGDDGIAIAYCLAVIERHASFSHPALEIVFSVDEEVGMDGAKALDASLLSSKLLINIDNEEENVAIVSCAGGARINAEREFAPTGSAQCFAVRLSGLPGGHSGTEITKGHPNAIICFAKALCGLDVRFCSFNGGEADNAIPSRCEAVIAADEVEIETLKARLGDFCAGERGRGAQFEIEPVGDRPVISREDSKLIIDTICKVSDGIISFGELPGTAKTSVNLGVASFDGGFLRLSHAFRSSSEDEKAFYSLQLANYYRQRGFDAEITGEYPAWEYKEQSALREVFAREHKRLYGFDMKFEAIHAGLECGIFCGKINGLDAISIGPNIYDIHSPKERLDKKSAERVFGLLISVLSSIGGINET